MRSTIQDQPATVARAVDMMDKLRDRGDGNGYTATCLILVAWGKDGSVHVLEDLVPDHLRAGPFMERLVDQILENAPISEYVAVRELAQRISPQNPSPPSGRG